MRSEMPTELAEGPRTVRTEGVVKRFGSTVALAGLDLEVPDGAVYVLVGPNGAGKTTLLRLLLDLLRPGRGRAEVFGEETDARPAGIRARVGYVPERQDFHYGWMKVRHLVRHHADYHTAWDAAYARELADRLEVPADRKFAHLSKGQARRVQLLLALAHRPPLLLLDEPTDGLDPMGKKQVLGLIADHVAATPTTVLVSTHLVYEVERLGDHLGVLRDGRLVAQVARDDLEERMKRYVATVPEAVDPTRRDHLSVLASSRAGRELQLTVWGEEARVIDRLQTDGAEVREVRRLSLEEAALTIMEGDQSRAGVRR